MKFAKAEKRVNEAVAMYRQGIALTQRLDELKERSPVVKQKIETFAHKNCARLTSRKRQIRVRQSLYFEKVLPAAGETKGLLIFRNKLHRKRRRKLKKLASK